MSARPSIILKRPVDAARDILGECLGKLQDISQPGVDVQPLVQKVAATIKTLFDIGPYDPLDPPHREGIRTALQLIGESLAMLQDAAGSDRAVFDASRGLAQVLSILYPISKAQQSMMPEARKSEAPRKEIPPHPRRTQTRIALNVDIGFQSENNFYTGFSEDISEGGIFLTTYDFKPLGTKMNITFTLPSGYVVMAAGTVRWIREFNPMTPETQPGMGVQFDALPPEDKAQIDAYIKTNATMFYEA